MKTCKQACSYVFILENYIKAHVPMYFLQFLLTFTPHYIIKVKWSIMCIFFSFPGLEVSAIIIFTCKNL